MFNPFPKIARLSREAIITEKIDGTNAQILIVDAFQSDMSLLETLDPTRAVAVIGSLVLFAGSRTRFITPQDDNYGFAGWVKRNSEELLTLGVGRHFGEWWGNGIQRKYGLTEKRFSLFNTTRWCLPGEIPKTFPNLNPREAPLVQEVLPACVGLVPELYRGIFDTATVEACVERLRSQGSQAAPGFMNAEGVVVYHTANGVGFKKTLTKDESPKSLQ